MKPILSISLALFSISSVGFAQQQKAVLKAVIKTPTVQCDICKDKVEFFISHEEGVGAVKVDIRKKTTTVSWYTDRTNLENIKVAIANLGYYADDIEPEEFAYKRLPKSCKVHKNEIKPAIPTKE